MVVITKLFYQVSGGDLSRLGKISIEEKYRGDLIQQFSIPKKHINFSEKLNDKSDTIDVLTIGDSFSQQGITGYQNFLAQNDSLKVVNFDINSFDVGDYNPIQFVNQILKGDVLDSIKVKYIVLQSVERFFVRRGVEIKDADKISLSDLENLKTSNKKKKNKSDSGSFFVDYIKFPLYSVLYFFNNHAFFAPVYKVQLKKEMFKTGDDLLFYDLDLRKTSYNNDTVSIKKLNFELNQLNSKLKAKSIKLIVLPSPDKYDLYYELLAKKNKAFKKPKFFEFWDKIDKEYLCIDSKKLLKAQIDNGEKDVYFADDTHWSPKAAKLIAKAISDIVQSK